MVKMLEHLSCSWYLTSDLEQMRPWELERLWEEEHLILVLIMTSSLGSNGEDIGTPFLLLVSDF